MFFLFLSYFFLLLLCWFSFFRLVWRNTWCYILRQRKRDRDISCNNTRNRWRGTTLVSVLFHCYCLFTSKNLLLVLRLVLYFRLKCFRWFKNRSQNFFFSLTRIFFLLCQAQNISWMEISEIMQYDRWESKSKKQCSGIWFPNDA